MSSLYFRCNKTAEVYPKTDTCAFLTLWLLYVLLQGNSVEMSMWLPKKTQLLGWSESLKRSGSELPADFDQRLTALRSKWDQLEVGLSLFSLLYEHVFSNAAKELRNIRAQSITSVRGPFVERKCFLNSRLSKSALLWHRWVSHLETDLSLIQSSLPRWEETGGLGRFGGERDAENARKTWEGIVRIKMLRKCILKHFCLKASFTSNWYMSKLLFLVLFELPSKISLCNVSALLW